MCLIEAVKVFDMSSIAVGKVSITFHIDSKWANDIQLFNKEFII